MYTPRAFCHSEAKSGSRHYLSRLQLGKVLRDIVKSSLARLLRILIGRSESGVLMVSDRYGRK